MRFRCFREMHSLVRDFTCFQMTGSHSTPAAAASGKYWKRGKSLTGNSAVTVSQLPSSCAQHGTPMSAMAVDLSTDDSEFYFSHSTPNSNGICCTNDYRNVSNRIIRREFWEIFFYLHRQSKNMLLNFCPLSSPHIFTCVF